MHSLPLSYVTAGLCAFLLFTILLQFFLAQRQVHFLVAQFILTVPAFALITNTSVYTPWGDLLSYTLPPLPSLYCYVIMIDSNQQSVFSSYAHDINVINIS